MMTNPESGMMDIDLGMSPTITLSESVQSGTINSTNVFLAISGTVVKIPSNLSLAADLRTVTIDPIDTLGQGTIYRIVVNSGVRDLAGNFLSPNVAVPFLTLMNDNIVYNVAPTTDTDTLDHDKFRVGMRILQGTNPSYVGRVMTGFRVYLRRSTGQPVPITGAESGIQLHIEKTTGDKIVFTNMFETHVDPEMLTDSLQAFDFHNHSNEYAFVANDKVMVEWISGTQFSGSVRIAKVNSNANEGAIKVERVGGTYSGSTYTEFSGQDLAGMMYVK
jgi:hypothetical protein